MTSSYVIALVVALACTALAHALLPGCTGRPLHEGTDERPARAGMGLWAGLLLSTAIIAYFQQRLPQPTGTLRGVGPSLWPLPLVALPILVLALRSDVSRPRSERHIAGLLATGLLLAFAGFAVDHVTAPWSGTVSLAPVVTVVVTVLWLFLLASIVELVGLVPMGVPLFGLALSLVVWLSRGSQQTTASYALAGIVAGAVLGRLLIDALLRRGFAYGKAEIFALGVWLTAMTTVSFLKSVALAGFVLPLGVLAVGLVVVMLRAFERSLILRETPRAE
ncbi:MAG: hypothetical protein KF858_16725 [Candidatus Sumerlaeia bacterium]|nr:hypothetical protein [Candidatus Sumerlaeia bacterium]